MTKWRLLFSMNRSANRATRVLDSGAVPQHDLAVKRASPLFRSLDESDKGLPLLLYFARRKRIAGHL